MPQDRRKMKGIISTYSQNRGYGFVEGEDGVNYFIHHSSYRGGYLSRGMHIRFETGVNSKGPYVTKVH